MIRRCEQESQLLISPKGLSTTPNHRRYNLGQFSLVSQKFCTVEDLSNVIWSKKSSHAPDSLKQISILLIAFVIVIGVVSTTQSQSSDNSNPALFAGHEIAPSAIMVRARPFCAGAAGLYSLRIHSTAQLRQASTSTATANSTISSSDVADLFVNFDFDTGGKSSTSCIRPTVAPLTRVTALSSMPSFQLLGT